MLYNSWHSTTSTRTPTSTSSRGLSRECRRVVQLATGNRACRTCRRGSSRDVRVGVGVVECQLYRRHAGIRRSTVYSRRTTTAIHVACKRLISSTNKWLPRNADRSIRRLTSECYLHSPTLQRSNVCFLSTDQHGSQPTEQRRDQARLFCRSDYNAPEYSQ